MRPPFDQPSLVRAFSASKLVDLVLGRCPRLLHFAPLAIPTAYCSLLTAYRLLLKLTAHYLPLTAHCLLLTAYCLLLLPEQDVFEKCVVSCEAGNTQSRQPIAKAAFENVTTNKS